MRHFIHDDPDVKVSLYELNQLKRYREEFQRLKGFSPRPSLSVEALKQAVEEARRELLRK